MKKYPLSTSGERLGGIIFSVGMIAVLAFLIYILRDNLLIMLVTAFGVLGVTVTLILYVLNVSKAAVVFDSKTRKLEIYGFRTRTIDLEQVSCLQTIPVKSGHVESRSLAFTNANGNVVAIVPTYFTSNRGMGAEPLAKQIAADLGIDFQENVPEWEYNKEARVAHDREVERQAKEDAKKRREAKAAYRVAKVRERMDESRSNDKS